MSLANTISVILTTAGIVIAWLTAGAAWWSYRGGHRERARLLGHLAWMTSLVALLVPVAGERLAAVFQPNGLTAPQAGLMAELSKGIVQGSWIYEMIRTVLFVVVTGSPGLIGIWIVVRCKRRASEDT
jgi:hypothetical protein